MNALRLKPFARLRGRLYPDDPEMGDLPMLFLIYLGFLLLPLAIRGNAAMAWIPTLLSLALFLPLYFWGWWRPPQLLPIVLSMAGLGLLLLPLNHGASTYTIFALAHAAELRPSKLAFGLLLGILGSFAALVWWLNMPSVVLLTAMVPGIAVWSAVRSFREAQRRRAVLKLSQDEVRRLGELAERERIARDLHDLLGHTLSVIVLKSELARKLLDRAPERAAREVAEVEALARRSLDEVRQTLRGIRRASLQQELAQSRLALESAGVVSQFQLAELPAALPAQTEAVLAFALREAVTNVIRHSQASQLRVELQARTDALQLEIQDNGRGGVQEHGQGLTGMAERIAALGGTLTVDSRRGEGTRLRLLLPPQATTSLAAPSAAAWSDAPAT